MFDLSKYCRVMDYFLTNVYLFISISINFIYRPKALGVRHCPSLDSSTYISNYPGAKRFVEETLYNVFLILHISIRWLSIYILFPTPLSPTDLYLRSDWYVWRSEGCVCGRRGQFRLLSPLQASHHSAHQETGIQSIYLSINLSIYLPFFQSIYLSIYLCRA